MVITFYYILDWLTLKRAKKMMHCIELVNMTFGFSYEKRQYW